jgi:hydroxyacylglutathione hydrolase
MVIFKTIKLTDIVTRIIGINGEQMYLIKGKDRAALVDTGSGAGDLKACVEALTDLPILVLLTHGHVDHAMGAPQFEEVYISELDWDVYRDNSGLETRKNYLSESPQFQDVEESDYIPAAGPEGFHNLTDGAVFDLGGITIEAVACAGHSPGSMMFLIREERSLITGDACAYFTMLQGDSCLGLSTYEHNLITANERTKGQYDRVYMSHGRFEPPVTLIEEVIEVCELVKSGKDDKVPFGFHGTNGLVAKAYGDNGASIYARLDGKTGNIIYNPARIWE